MNSTTKKCSKCETEKLLTEFHKNRSKKDGYANWCKSCLKDHLARPEQREKRIKRQKRYDDKPEAKRKKRLAANKRIKENGRWEQTPEGREWAKTYHKKYREENKEKTNEIMLQATHRRRARLLENGYEYFTEQELVEHWKENNIDPNKCFYCETAPYEHKDHFIPVAKGGSHSMNNLRPSCATCNVRKSNKDPEDWLLEIQSITFTLPP